MNEQTANAKMLTRLMFRLLPIQTLLMGISAVNGIVSSFFATNYVGVDAMTAVGLYSPVTLLLTAISTMLSGGSAILCGKYMGRNDQEKLQSVYNLNLVISVMFSVLIIAAMVLMGLFDLTGIFTQDTAVRPIFNRYLLGQAIGVIPLILGNQFPAYLILENRTRTTTVASLVYIAFNIVLNYIFVQVLHLEAFGLALASSLGLWAFLAIVAWRFVSGRSHLRLSLKNLRWRESGEMIKTGFPGAVTSGYLSIRGLIVNNLLTAYVGSVGVSAFAASGNLLNIFWAVPAGMQAVSRLMFSVSIGEEDRHTLTDTMRVMFRRFIPLQCAIAALIIVCAVPFTRVFFRDPSEPVYMMTVWAYRILPLCMPFSVVCMHFVSYNQASSRMGFVHIISVLDGVVCVAGFTALLIGTQGINGAYFANVLNGVVTVLFIFAYAWFRNKHFPRNMEELMVIPDDFGVPADERMDITIRNMDEVVKISEQVQKFCLQRGIDDRRSLIAGLSMEEMAGNVIEYGFAKDSKPHSIDIRVVHKNGDVILRIKDDCAPFDPAARQRLADKEDVTANIGLRMVFKTARDVNYQNILGLNVLTIKI